MPLQLHQNINLLSLLVVGSFVANIYLDWESIVLILLYTFLVEHILLYFNKNRGFYLSYASLSTAVGVIVLMYSEKLWIYGIVIGLGLLQKHLLTIEKRHLFNPSNFALSDANEHIRKIVVRKKDHLELQTIPFSYSLITQTSEQGVRSHHLLSYNKTNNSWELKIKR